MGFFDYPFINQSSTIGHIVQGVSVNATGDAFLAYLLVGVIGLLIMCFMFRIPLEVSMLLVLPILLTCMAWIGNFTPLAGIILIYIGLLFAKHFFFIR